MATRAADLPQGFVIDKPEPPEKLAVPDGFILDEARSEQNFFERSYDRLKERFGEQGAEIINARVRGDQGFVSTALQLTGKVGAGSIMDLMGELIVSGGRGLSTITPDVIEDPIKAGAKGAAVALLDTELGRKGLEAAKNGVEEYAEFKAENPVMARNIESVVNIGLLIAPVKAKAKPARTTFVGKAGEKISRSGSRAAVKEKENFVFNLIRPKETPTSLVDEVGRATERGLLRKQIVDPSPQQRAVMAEIMGKRIPVSPRKSVQGNYNELAKYVDKEASRLASRLAKSRAKYNPDELASKFDEVLLAQRSNPVLVGDAAKSAERVIDLAKKAAADNKKTLSGLLRARKDLDNRLRQLKGNVFSPDSDDAIKIAVRDVRQAMNDFIAQRAPGVRVKRSLESQSRILRAMDEIKPKAAAEANNAISRSMQKLIKVMPLRGEFNSVMAAIFGVGGLGAAAMFAPIFRNLLGITAAAWLGKRAIVRPGTRKALGKLLKNIDKASQKITDPAALRELRADRALIVELLQNAEEQIEDEPEQ